MKFFEIEKINDFYQSTNLWNPLPSFPVYGGQIVSQATKVAYEHLEKSFHVHSLHNYFLRPANILNHIEYKPSTLHLGNCFISKKIEAFQNGELISVMNISFTRKLDNNLSYQSESLKIYEDSYINIVEQFGMSITKDRDMSLEANKKLLENIITHIDYLKDIIEIEMGKPHLNKRQIKFSLKKSIKSEEDKACFIAFMSDFFLIEPGLIVLNEDIFGGNIKKYTSLDHSMNFHGNNFEKVLILQTECLRIVDSRVFCIGHIFNENGELIASASQEGLLIIKK